MQLFAMLLFYWEDGSLNLTFLVYSRKFGTPSTEVHKGGRTLTARHPGTHGVFHGVWWESV